MATALYTAPVRPSLPVLDDESLALVLEIMDLEGLGFQAAVAIADMELPSLIDYAHTWDCWSKAQQEAHTAQATCPMCGAPIVGVQYYIGGKGYVWFDVCS